MKYLPKVNKADYKFMSVDPEVGFDPEHNRQVIENTIKKYEATRRKKMQEHTDKVEERSAALATYLKSSEQGGATSDIKGYFGKKALAYLRGQDILEKLKAAQNAQKTN